MFGGGPFGLDEGALRDPKNSLHHNGWREAFSVMLVVWILGTILFTQISFAPIPRVVIMAFVLIVGIALGLGFRWLLFGRVNNKLAERKEQNEIELRKNLESEREKQIAVAKASGKFDRFSNDNDISAKAVDGEKNV